MVILSGNGGINKKTMDKNKTRFSSKPRNSGFHMIFENDWSISVQWGGGTYSSNHLADIQTYNQSNIITSDTAEIAIIDPNGEMIQVTPVTVDDSDLYDADTVLGYCSPDDVLDFMNEIRAIDSNSVNMWKIDPKLTLKYIIKDNINIERIYKLYLERKSEYGLLPYNLLYITKHGATSIKI